MTDTTRPPAASRPGLLEQDNYGVALAAAAEELAGRDPDRLAALLGVRQPDDAHLELDFFAEPVRVATDTWTVTGAGGEPLPSPEQILVLHYLLGGDARPLDRSDDWLAYRELPEASFYAAAFARQVCQPLAHHFGEAPEKLTALVGRWGSTAGELGDASLQLEALPGLHLVLVVWAGDDDFPPEGNVLFNRDVGTCLTAEDAAVLADMALRRVLPA